MTGPIFVFNPKGDLVPIHEQSYETEDVFQKLLAEYPQLLLSDDERTPYSRLLLIAREQGVPIEEGGGDYFSLDHLFVDQDGVPTLVEVKRRSDSRRRREMVAQMLDYAANGLAFWTIDDLRSTFDTTCEEDDRNPEEVLKGFLGDDEDVEVFWLKVEENIRAERIRMVFVGDDIPAELRRIVSFLNRQMRTSEMLAIELKQFVGQGVRAFVPDVVVKPETIPTPRRRGKWDEESFMEELERQQGAEAVATARALLEWGLRNTTKISWGKGKINGSFSPVLVTDDGNSNPLCVYSYGPVDVQFGYLAYSEPFTTLKKRKELQRRLNAIPGIAIPDDRIEGFPSIALQTLADVQTRNAFLAVLEWVIDEIRATGCS